MLKTEALVMLLHLGRHTNKNLLIVLLHFFFFFQPGNESIKSLQYWIKKIKSSIHSWKTVINH